MNVQSLKHKLKSIAHEQGRPIQEIWKLLLLERFLIRLSHSKYHDVFIFKGGLLLSHYLYIGRETSDIDLLARKIKTEKKNFEKCFSEICSTVVNDGFAMHLVEVEALDHAHMNYPGYRMKIHVEIGNMKDRIYIDVGAGDIVNPNKERLRVFQYKGTPIFEGAISLQVYPVETIFSEKLESIISRGSANSRMKDYHDVLLLCRNDHLLNIVFLGNNIENTFKQRGTSKSFPVHFTEKEYIQLQSLWSAHLHVLGGISKQLNMPHKISDLVSEVNNWIERHFVLGVSLLPEKT